MQQKTIAIGAVICVMIGLVACHAGLNYPNPRGIECSATVSLNFCGKVQAPCGGKSKVRFNYKRINEFLQESV